MKNIWNIAKNIAAVLGVLAFLFGFTSKGYELYNDLADRVFTSIEIKDEVEKYHSRVSVDKIDRIEILDSIKNAEEEKWRLNQEKRMYEIERLLRLNVSLTDKASKKQDTLKKQVEHTLEHVD